MARAQAREKFQNDRSSKHATICIKIGVGLCDRFPKNGKVVFASKQNLVSSCESNL